MLTTGDEDEWLAPIVPPLGWGLTSSPGEGTMERATIGGASSSGLVREADGKEATAAVAEESSTCTSYRIPVRICR